MTAASLGSGNLAGPTMFSEGDFQVGLWGDTNGNVYVVTFDRSTGALGNQYALVFAPGNPLSLPMDNLDAHEVPGGMIDPQGYIWIAANMWATDTFRMVRSQNPFDIMSWVDAGAQIPDPTDAKHGYPHFFKFSDGALGLITRQRIDTVTVGDNPGGERMFYLPVGSTTWVDRGYFAKGDAATEDAFYRNQPYVDANDRLHIAGAWDQSYGGGTVVSNSSYMYSDDRGVTWRNIAGTLLTTPINRTGASGVSCRTNISYDSDTNNLYGMNGFALDAQGYPCFVYSKFAQAQRIVRWNGSAWSVDESAGSYYGGGQNLNLINWRGDLWGLHRVDSMLEMRRHDGSVHEIIRLGGHCTTGFYPWPDPQVLLNEGLIEILCHDTALYPTPKRWVFGNNARMVEV